MSYPDDFGKVLEAHPCHVDRISMAINKEGEVVIVLYVHDFKEDVITNYVITRNNSIELAETLQLINDKVTKHNKSNKRKGDDPSWN